MGDYALRNFSCCEGNVSMRITVRSYEQCAIPLKRFGRYFPLPPLSEMQTFVVWVDRGLYFFSCINLGSTLSVVK